MLMKMASLPREPSLGGFFCLTWLCDVLSDLTWKSKTFHTIKFEIVPNVRQNLNKFHSVLAPLTRGLLLKIT